jgi:mannose-6-phosphate isomerase-like protein (cupin superfamily)
MHYGHRQGEDAQHHVVPKGWGYELWIVNNEKYCGKILHLNAGKKFSWHYHILKDETFYIRSGRIKLLYGWDEDINKAVELTLGPDSSFHIPPKLIHQIIALEDSDVFEFSTQHFDEDSYRILKGD